MATASKDDYPLERSFLGASRLYFTHWLWDKLLGHLLHPSIPRTNDMRVADIACGSGYPQTGDNNPCRIWLLDLAKELSKSKISAQLDGFDISTKMYPPPITLPTNVRLDTLDIFQPIPEALRGWYDVVHIRLLCLVIPNGDPRPVLDNILTLLKPGGYIQWDDSDFGNIYCPSSNPELKCTNLEKEREWIYKVPLSRLGGISNFKWISELEHIFQSRDIAVIQDGLFAQDDDIAYSHAWTIMHMMGLEELASASGEGSKEVHELLERAAEEVRQGGSFNMDLVSVVGRKAGGI
ncbi:umta methyltransferase family protein [Rutstroemia sp. NJR-2017a WRK4]|nr:umta methyltransferase family protein [Rutstroemia sp. NJR-2017a WRK4]